MRKLLLVTVLALCAGVAHADNGVLYIGAGYTNDDLRDIVAPNTTNSVNFRHIGATGLSAYRSQVIFGI